MDYTINISTTTVSKDRHMVVTDDRHKCSCINMASCFNVDCEDCIFDGDNSYYLEELISRIKIK